MANPMASNIQPQADLEQGRALITQSQITREERGPLLEKSIAGKHGAGGHGKALQRDRRAGPGPFANLALYVAPCFLFTLLTLLFTFGVSHYPLVVWSVVLFSSLFAFVNFVAGGWDGNHYQLFLGMLCCFAIFTGVVGGLGNYSWNMRPYYHFLESREYGNVLPSEPAAAHGDAGLMTFAVGSTVDTAKSVGYNHGSLYCVAPIIDKFTLPRVEYWAVGVNCCAQRSDFACDDSKVDGVRSGIVRLDDAFLTGSEQDHFREAVKVAESAFDVQSSSDAIFVSWVKDPTGTNNALQTRAIISWAVLVGAFGLLNALLAFAASYLAKSHEENLKKAAKAERQGLGM